MQNKEVQHQPVAITEATPVNAQMQGRDRLVSFVTKLSAATSTVTAMVLSKGSAAKAIGTLYELKYQSVVLQDIAFNVENTYNDAAAMQALFQDNMKPLRTSTVNKVNMTVMAFGPDAYASPKAFYPGVSTFYEDGGHSTITVMAKRLDTDDDVVQLFDKGNGLQYVKVGADTIRLSKAIEKGCEIKYAYGWIDLNTPGGLPLEVVVGLARDPLMLACIRVSDVQLSTKFFTEELGMKELPFPLSRTAGSDFEPQQPPNSVYVGYGADSMGLLLVPGAKGAPPLSVGSFLEAFTLVFDESKAQSLPQAFQGAAKGGERRVLSPDGYPFVLKGYDEYRKQATNQATF